MALPDALLPFKQAMIAKGKKKPKKKHRRGAPPAADARGNPFAKKP